MLRCCSSRQDSFKLFHFILKSMVKCSTTYVLLVYTQIEHKLLDLLFLFLNIYLLFMTINIIFIFVIYLYFTMWNLWPSQHIRHHRMSTSSSPCTFVFTACQHHHHHAHSSSQHVNIIITIHIPHHIMSTSSSSCTFVITACQHHHHHAMAPL